MNTCLSLHRISFIYNPTASFLRHRIVEWPWIKLKMRPMPFKKSWNLFCSNVIKHLVKLVVNNIVFFLWSIKNLLRVCMWVCLSVCAYWCVCLHLHLWIQKSKCWNIFIFFEEQQQKANNNKLYYEKSESPV